MAKILVVDDEPTVRAFLYRGMQGRHHVMMAGNGLEALLLFQNYPVDLIICDIHMPEINGPELVHRLREIHGDDAIRVVFITGYPTAFDVPVLLKPFRISDVLTAVQDALENVKPVPTSLDKRISRVRSDVRSLLKRQQLQTT
jgi:CheY-like chemotaxis protein